MLIIKEGTLINLQVRVRSVYLLATHMARKGGSCLTLKPKRFLSLEMLNSLRPNILFVDDVATRNKIGAVKKLLMMCLMM